jgi:hypothetical protein
VLPFIEKTTTRQCFGRCWPKYIRYDPKEDKSFTKAKYKEYKSNASQPKMERITLLYEVKILDKAPHGFWDQVTNLD